MEYDSLHSEDVVFSDQDETVDYEDLDTTIHHEKSGIRAKGRMEWSQRLLVASRTLTIMHIVLNIRLIMFAWTSYTVMGRFFVMLPLAIESALSLLFEALGTNSLQIFIKSIL